MPFPKRDGGAVQENILPYFHAEALLGHLQFEHFRGVLDNLKTKGDIFLGFLGLQPKHRTPKTAFMNGSHLKTWSWEAASTLTLVTATFCQERQNLKARSKA